MPIPLPKLVASAKMLSSAGSYVDHPVIRMQIASHDLLIVPGHGFALVPHSREIPSRPLAHGLGDPHDLFVVRTISPAE
jgi:hypothetical protein